MLFSPQCAMALQLLRCVAWRVLWPSIAMQLLVCCNPKLLWPCLCSGSLWLAQLVRSQFEPQYKEWRSYSCIAAK